MKVLSNLVKILRYSMGSGKTLTTTTFSILDFMETGRKIIANYRIDLEKINDGDQFIREVHMAPWDVYYGKQLVDTVEACHDKSAAMKVAIKHPGADPSMLRAVMKEGHDTHNDSFVYLQYEEFIKDMEENREFFNVNFCIDEAYLWADSRLSQTQYSRLLTYFVLQSRKREVDLYVTTQQYENVDIRLRKNAEVRALCRFSKRTQIAVVRLLDLRSGLRRRVRFYGPDYYKFYSTKEIPPLQAMHTAIDTKHLI